MKTKLDLASTLMEMNYGDLKAVAADFSSMCAPDNGVRLYPKSPEDFAEMLFDWAEATKEEG